ncbi:Uncharacterised protein [Mycobacteroides abscessus subsp. abscessus]|nr:Uncharacterised protein [Mycobacteroides abscessus subsp. abscessus]
MCQSEMSTERQSCTLPSPNSVSLRAHRWFWPIEVSDHGESM